MRSTLVGVLLLLLACLLFYAADAPAQQVTVGTPFHSLNDSFFENMGSSWGLQGRNWNFSFGGGNPNMAAPQFGGFDPQAGGNFGFGFNRGGLGGQFSGNFGQGSRRSFVSQTPSVTLQNGVPGYISDTSQSPFVISYIPIVGGFPSVGFLNPVPLPPVPGPFSRLRDPAVLNALQRARAARQQGDMGGAPDEPIGAVGPPVQPAVRPPAQARGGHDDLVLGGPAPAPVPADEGPLDESARKLAAARSSSAGRPAPSVAEARRLHAAEQAEQDAEAMQYLERARNAEATGKTNVAKIFYQMAARRASGELRAKILDSLQAMETASGTTP